MKVKCQYCGKKVHEKGLEEHYKSKRCWRARHVHLLNSPGSTMTITCLCGCGKKKKVRKADFKRGWGMFFSKSCKAIWQERATGQYSRLKNNYYGGVSKEKYLRYFEEYGGHPTFNSRTGDYEGILLCGDDFAEGQIQ